MHFTDGPAPRNYRDAVTAAIATARSIPSRCRKRHSRQSAKPSSSLSTAHDDAVIDETLAAATTSDGPLDERHPPRGVSKRYGPVAAADNVDLAVAPGEFVTILGPSGSGKTTLLSLIAGLTAPTGGRIFIGGRDVTQAAAQERNIGLVFQSTPCSRT